MQDTEKEQGTPPGEEAVQPPDTDKAQEAAQDRSDEGKAETPSKSDAPPKTGKKKKKSAWYYALTFFLKIGLTALAVWALLTYVGGVFMCHDNKAYPMIKDGDLVITYRLDKLKQGDVTAYRRDGSIRFGRVIAFEGDVVDIAGDYVTVNGYGLYEDTVYPTPSEGAAVQFPYTVPDGTVFVLNDYRSDLGDSRTYGAIPTEDTQGKAIFVMRRRGI